MRRYSSTLPVPGWPGGGGIRWSYSFAGLFFVSTFSRAILISVLPLQALELLGDAQAVSVLYFSVASIGIVASIAIPNLVRRIGSHATFFLGLIAMIISVVLLSSESTPVFVIGLPLHFLSVAAIEVPLNFYILSEVPRRELTRFEPLRILCTVLAYTVGPWLGVFLESRVDHMLPFVLAIGSTVVTMWHFGWLRLGDTGDAISAGPLVNPLRHVRRFLRAAEDAPRLGPRAGSLVLVDDVHGLYADLRRALRPR